MDPWVPKMEVPASLEPIRGSKVATLDPHMGGAGGGS